MVQYPSVPRSTFRTAAVLVQFELSFEKVFRLPLSIFVEKHSNPAYYYECLLGHIWCD